jgi:uncharacterized integral membrane protein (TIGR00697 family)
MVSVILIILTISAFTLMGSWYARRLERADALIALYVIFAALSQIMASKIAVFDLGFTSFTAPAAVLVFAVTFLMTDIVNEKFGQRQVHEMIFITLVTQVAMMVFLWIGGFLPAAPFWKNQDAWDTLLGVVPRITVASWITFLVSENLDAWLFAMIRRWTKGRHLWARNVFSTIPSLTVDTILFITLAFAGTGLPLLSLMTGQFATKYLVGIVNIPFMYLNRAMLGPRLASAELKPQTHAALS